VYTVKIALRKVLKVMITWDDYRVLKNLFIIYSCRSIVCLFQLDFSPTSRYFSKVNKAILWGILKEQRKKYLFFLIPLIPVKLLLTCKINLNVS